MMGMEDVRVLALFQNIACQIIAASFTTAVGNNGNFVFTR